MVGYRLYCLDRAGRIDLADWLDAADDDDAIDQARSLKNGARMCELWQRDRLVTNFGTSQLSGVGRTEVSNRLRISVDRCRRLAEQASDTEAADALRLLADELEAAIPFLQNKRRGD